MGKDSVERNVYRTRERYEGDRKGNIGAKFGDRCVTKWKYEGGISHSIFSVVTPELRFTSTGEIYNTYSTDGKHTNFSWGIAVFWSVLLFMQRIRQCMDEGPNSRYSETLNHIIDIPLLCLIILKHKFVLVFNSFLVFF